MNLLLIVIAILAVVAILQLGHLKHRLLVIGVVILAVAFYFTFTFALSDQDIDLGSPSGLIEASRIYFAWFGQAATNLQAITGEAVKMDWVPEAPEKKDPDVMTG